MGAANPLSPNAQDGATHNRIHKYHQTRDKMDKDTTSRLRFASNHLFHSGIKSPCSVYLSSGVISVRECIRQTMRLTGSKKVDGNTSAGIGRWIQELAWRDFYTGILAHYPRVSMGRPYLEKLSKVVWENHQMPQDSAGGHENCDSENLKRWKEGKTGVPIVDASMRCLNEMGWVHNRARMITAMYLTKDLMIDWRLGERVCILYCAQVTYTYLIQLVFHANPD
jgi:deoxyribodipyrimidine photo-lyase